MTPSDGERPLTILSAGSLREALGEIVRLHAPTAEVTFGPAGLLRERIEEVCPFDLFLSADMGHPRRLAAQGLANDVERFVRNRICAVARASLGLDERTLLPAMADPDVKLGTSTPSADPSGDYAVEFFRRVEARHPGLGASLAAKSLPLVGGRAGPSVPEGVSAAAFLIEKGLADVFIGYATGARLLIEDPYYAVIPLPDELAPVAEYGLCLAPNAGHDAQAFRDLLLGNMGQSILTSFGFLIA